MDAGSICEELIILLTGLCGEINFADVKGLSELQESASDLGLKICTCWECGNPDGPVQDKKNFRMDTRRPDCLGTYCRTCTNTPGLINRARSERKRIANEEVSKIKVREPRHNIQDKIVQHYLLPALQQVFTCILMPEFRLADLGILLQGLYIQIHVKIDGPYKSNGTLKRDGSKSNHGNAKHSNCSRYVGMLVVFIKVRIVNGVQKFYMWFTEDIVNDAMCENTDGTLGPQRLPRGTMQELIEAIHKSSLPRVTLRHIWMNVPLLNHFKEVCYIEAFRMIYTVSVPEGNQQIFDCILDEQQVQVKGHNVQSGMAALYRCVNGCKNKPYNSSDPIDAFVVACIIVCQQRFFLLHTLFKKDTLIQNKKLVHEKCDKYEESNGSRCLHVHLGIYEKMLTGKVKAAAHAEWLKDYPFKHIELVPHTDENPQPHQLTFEDLRKVAQGVANERAMPNEMK